MMWPPGRPHSNIKLCLSTQALGRGGLHLCLFCRVHVHFVYETGQVPALMGHYIRYMSNPTGICVDSDIGDAGSRTMGSLRLTLITSLRTYASRLPIPVIFSSQHGNHSEGWGGTCGPSLLRGKLLCFCAWCLRPCSVPPVTLPEGPSPLSRLLD